MVETLFWLILGHSVLWGLLIAYSPFEKSVVGYLLSFVVGFVIGFVALPSYVKLLIRRPKGRLY